MKLNNITKLLPVLGAVILAASSCDKPKTYDPIGGAGSTYVKITGGGTPAEYEKKSIDFVPTPSIVGVDIQRLVANSTELQKTMKVVIKIDTAMVTNYNTVNHTNYVKIPNAWYTGSAKNPKAGGEDGTFTMTFNPGEFAKDLEILIPNATLLDPSTTYAIGLTIQSVDADGKISNSKSKVIGIGAKNTYDGAYTVDIYQSGWAAYSIASGTTSTYPGDLLLVTKAAASNDVLNGYTGTNLLAGFDATGAATQFGATSAVFTFNPATNKLSAVTNSTPDDGRGRTLFLDPASTVSAFNPATKGIVAEFFMTQTGRPNQFFRFTMKYKGAR